MEQVAEATAGGVGAIVSVLTTYPLTTTKIRLQAQRKKTGPISKGHINGPARKASNTSKASKAVNEDQQQGKQKQKSYANVVSEGLPSKHDNAHIFNTKFSLVNESSEDESAHESNAKTSISNELSANQGDEKNDKNADADRPYSGAFDCIYRTGVENGIAGFFSGIESALFKGFWTNFVFYYCFSWLKVVFQPHGAPKPGMLKSMLHGIIAGIAVQLVMSPVDAVNTFMVVDNKSGASPIAIVRRMIKERGLLSLWAGIAPALVLTLNPGITNVVREALTPVGRPATRAENFRIGAGSKALASLVTYPYVVAKVTMQMLSFQQTSADTKTEQSNPNKNNNDVASRSSSTSTKNTKAHPTTIGIIRNIIRSEGVTGLYKGSELQVFIAVLKEAIMNVVRAEINLKVMAAFGRLAKKKQ